MNNQAPERRRVEAKPENKRAAALEIGIRCNKQCCNKGIRIVKTFS
jgi:hypothetical protein